MDNNVPNSNTAKKRKTLGEKLHHNSSITKAQKRIPCKLGKILARRVDNSVVLKGRIVETECYPGGDDKASHSYNGRRTNCNEAMYMEAGTSYVYNIYGMYCCFNISSSEPGGVVLIRALEPLTGLDSMNENRRKKRPPKKPLKNKELCNGPSKLCISLGIDKESCNKISLASSASLWVEDDYFCGFSVVESTRIGIESCGEESAKKLLRFYVLGSACVSKRDVARETQI